ncbi:MULTISPECIES: hypothetical protein [unclassified Moraxella]|uniref:hypothetical protein n=1 Tax=unclassified Moraxella TaxID=2685852 RepID=UPI003AF5DFD2
MQIQAYKETYHQPVRSIDVPKDLQNHPFEVVFMPINQPVKSISNNKSRKRQPNPALKGLMIIHDDITPIDDNEWELD